MHATQHKFQSLDTLVVLIIQTVKIPAADSDVVLWPLQEMALLRSQMGGQVNVAVDASPAQDLNQVMTEIREHYEGAINKNRKELEAWYQNKVRS